MDIFIRPSSADEKGHYEFMYELGKNNKTFLVFHINCDVRTSTSLKMMNDEAVWRYLYGSAKG